MNFDIRPYTSPVFSGSYAINGPIDNFWEPAPGHLVSLKAQGIPITVRITTADSQHYKGEIEDIDSDQREFEGKKIGDLVGFTYGNIFGCMR